MKELTENTALPAPGGPYPGGGRWPYFSIVSRYTSRRRMWYSSGAPSGFALPSGVVGSGHQVVKRGVTPRDMKKSSPSAVERIASSMLVKPYGLRHLDPGHEVRDHVAGAEDVARVEDAAVPLLASHVPLLPGETSLKIRSSHTS